MSDLDAFLSRGEQEPAPEVQEPAPQPEPKPEPEKPAEPEPAEGEPEGDAPPEDVPTDRTELGKALVAARKDYKEKAARLEGELAELRRQYEEIRKAPQQPPQSQQQPEQHVPDPMLDPRGFFAWQSEQMARAELNTRLNLSEAHARQQYGAEKVDAAVQEFSEAVKRNPALYQQMVQHPLPYEFVVQQGEALRLQREIGTDPKGYEAKLRERILAELAEQQPAAPSGPAVPRMGPSLANVRSAAPRSAPAYSGPTPIGDILGRS